MVPTTATNQRDTRGYAMKNEPDCNNCKHAGHHRDVLVCCRKPLCGSCSVQRSGGLLFARMTGRCGREGRFFEPYEYNQTEEKS